MQRRAVGHWVSWVFGRVEDKVALRLRVWHGQTGCGCYMIVNDLANPPAVARAKGSTGAGSVAGCSAPSGERSVVGLDQSSSTVVAEEVVDHCNGAVAAVEGDEVVRPGPAVGAGRGGVAEGPVAAVAVGVDVDMDGDALAAVAAAVVAAAAAVAAVIAAAADDIEVAAVVGGGR